ncbi:MAG: lysoplasmalogenase, partial [Spirosomataceae bacterium]
VYFLKPVIVSSLILLVASKGFLKNWQFITALSFSLLGDVFLMIGVPHLFLFGLGSFLLTHIFYINIFRRKAAFKPVIIVAFLLIVTVFFFTVLRPNVPADFLLPVFVYMLVITAMGIMGSSVQFKNRTMYLLPLGAVLFIISDSLIAINKFVGDIPFPTLLIMSTYGVAQLFITKAYLKIFSDSSSIE